MAEEIRHDRPTPVYRQLAEIIIRQIKDGTLEPGQMLPSETSLRQQYEIGRDSVRHAMQVLRDGGWIITVHAKGSFVAERPPVQT